MDCAAHHGFCGLHDAFRHGLFDHLQFFASQSLGRQSLRPDDALGDILPGVGLVGPVIQIARLQHPFMGFRGHVRREDSLAEGVAKGITRCVPAVVGRHLIGQAALEEPLHECLVGAVAVGRIRHDDPFSRLHVLLDVVQESGFVLIDDTVVGGPVGFRRNAIVRRILGQQEIRFGRMTRREGAGRKDMFPDGNPGRVVFVGRHRVRAHTGGVMRVDERIIVCQAVHRLRHEQKAHLVRPGEEADLPAGHVADDGRNSAGLVMGLRQRRRIVPADEHVVEALVLHAVQEERRRFEVQGAAAVIVLCQILGDFPVQGFQFLLFPASEALQFLLVPEHALAEQLAAPLLVVDRFRRRTAHLRGPHDGHEDVGIRAAATFLQVQEAFGAGGQHGFVVMMRAGIHQAAIQHRVGTGNDSHGTGGLILEPFEDLVRITGPEGRRQQFLGRDLHVPAGVAHGADRVIVRYRTGVQGHIGDSAPAQGGSGCFRRQDRQRRNRQCRQDAP